MRGLSRTAVVLLLAWGLLGTSVLAKSDADITVYITRTGEKYHIGSCRYLKKSKIKTTLKKAKEDGYEPCSVCDPPV